MKNKKKEQRWKDVRSQLQLINFICVISFCRYFQNTVMSTTEHNSLILIVLKQVEFSII